MKMNKKLMNLEIFRNCQVLIWGAAIPYPLSPRKKKKKKRKKNFGAVTALVIISWTTSTRELRQRAQNFSYSATAQPY